MKAPVLLVKYADGSVRVRNLSNLSEKYGSAFLFLPLISMLNFSRERDERSTQKIFEWSRGVEQGLPPAVHCFFKYLKSVEIHFLTGTLNVSRSICERSRVFQLVPHLCQRRQYFVCSPAITRAPNTLLHEIFTQLCSGFITSRTNATKLLYTPETN